MAYEPKPGDISLFPASEEDKNRVSKDLVMSGNGLDLSGQDCWASLFRATKKDGTLVKTKDGAQVYNLRLKAKAGVGGGGGQDINLDAGRKVEASSFDDSDIPFIRWE
jgi:hypothetical protein